MIYMAMHCSTLFRKSQCEHRNWREIKDGEIEGTREKGEGRREREGEERKRDLQMAFHFIIRQAINLHQLPDLLWGGNCKRKLEASMIVSRIRSHYGPHELQSIII